MECKPVLVCICHWNPTADVSSGIRKLNGIDAALRKESDAYRFDQAIQYYSCFISYSSKDQDLADRIHADLLT